MKSWCALIHPFHYTHALLVGASFSMLKELQVVTVTRYGKPVMTILAAHTYKALQKTIEKLQEEVDGLLETLEILKDEETMAAFHRGVEDIKAGRVIPWEEVKKELELE
jgi:PHD/YefM family antitoxin component YafN of YafNO toxin-antitoxin module